MGKSFLFCEFCRQVDNMKILLIFPLPSHSSCVEKERKKKTVLLKHNQHNNNNDDNEIVKECGEKA